MIVDDLPRTLVAQRAITLAHRDDLPRLADLLEPLPPDQLVELVAATDRLSHVAGWALSRKRP
ncbi:hypothetical protein [Bailinhaonella thermotolerans]|uniref:Uncharacterized protein n=1 Tax=Bailinhaonella thermotolerans TaxID=1070861 RepID=A0A3A3ZZH4_9ACTN|nr:hypothetical protein [Bailinhaonella thermotolerans]RJL21109.1 hypothetical protein D5H75_38510 [Bailinhaonella thermotolerans]